MDRTNAKNYFCDELNKVNKTVSFSIDGRMSGLFNANEFIDIMQEYAAQQVAAERERIKDIIEREMELEQKAASSPPSVHPTQHYTTLEWMLKRIDSL